MSKIAVGSIAQLLPAEPGWRVVTYSGEFSDPPPIEVRPVLMWALVNVSDDVFGEEVEQEVRPVFFDCGGLTSSHEWIRLHRDPADGCFPSVCLLPPGRDAEVEVARLTRINAKRLAKWLAENPDEDDDGEVS